MFQRGLLTALVKASRDRTLTSSAFHWDSLCLRRKVVGDAPRVPGEGPKEIGTVLPRGVSINPEAVQSSGPRLSSRLKFLRIGGNSRGCPAASQVGTISLSVMPGLTVGSETVPIFEMQAPTGTPAALGFQAVAPGVYFHLVGSVDSEGNYELVAQAPDVSNKFPIAGAKVTLWGNPLAPEHDAPRGECAYVTSTCPVSGQGQPRPYVSLPSQCSAALEGEVSAASWLNPDAAVRRRFTVTDLAGNVQPNADCGSLAFTPTIAAQPSTHLTDSPAGLSVNLHQPQNEDVNGRATATLQDMQVVLPKGVW